MRRMIRGVAVTLATAALVGMGALSAQAAEETTTVLDPENVAGADGWQVTDVEIDPTCASVNEPDSTPPFDAIHASDRLSIRTDQNLGGGDCYGTWPGYEAAPNSWTITKTFTAPEDGFAVLEAFDFRADGGARVLINGQDVGLYSQWNQPAVGGSQSVPVVAGENTIEIVVRDVGGPTWVTGRLDITTFEEDDIPLVTAALALVAGGLALAGAGAHRRRRRDDQ